MTINKTDIELIEGKSFTLSLTIKPKNNTEKIKWTSSDESVASVSNGVVTAKKKGTTLITAKSSSGKIAICDVEVKPKEIEATKITLDKTSATLTTNTSLTLKVTFEPSNTEARTLTWTSSNPSVASVVDGKVTALKAGDALITVKTENNKAEINSKNRDNFKAYFKLLYLVTIKNNEVDLCHPKCLKLINTSEAFHITEMFRCHMTKKTLENLQNTRI